MKTLLGRVIYQPFLILPLLVLTQLMVTLDFSVTQVTLIVVAKTAHAAYRHATHWVLDVAWRRLAGGWRAMRLLGDTLHDECCCKG
jgi:hypothetical protein